MKKKVCPACKIAALFLINTQGERLSIYVDEHYTIIPKQAETSIEGFNTETIYCYGCSWKGSIKMLR